MSTEANKVTIRHNMEEINKRNLAPTDEFAALNYVAQAHITTLQGREQRKHFFTMFLAAFPDVHFTVEDQIAEGDQVVTRLTARGTHQGTLVGIPPTGK